MRVDIASCGSRFAGSGPGNPGLEWARIWVEKGGVGGVCQNRGSLTLKRGSAHQPEWA
jgi:hypothetical protein